MVNSNEDYPHQLVEPHSSLADMYDFLLQYIQVWFKKRFEKRLKKYIQVEYHQSITIFQYVHESIFFPQYTRVRSNQYTAQRTSRSDFLSASSSQSSSSSSSQSHRPRHPPPHPPHHYQRIAGDESIGFNNSVFLSERASADRNFSMGYFMKVVQCPW